MNNYPQAAGATVQNKNKCGSNGDSAAAPFLQGVKVKALKWFDCAAQTPFGEYTIQFDDDEEMHETPYCLGSPNDNLGHYSDEEAAKSAAQADYEARIMSAIEMSPSPRALALEALFDAVTLMQKHDEKFEGEIPLATIQKVYVARTAAIRALSSQPVADGWLPIETAPSGNGSNLFLAYITGHGPCVCFRSSSGSVYSVDGRTILRATHWRPLPASPGRRNERQTSIPIRRRRQQRQ